jgi:hypothetical protein
MNTWNILEACVSLLLVIYLLWQEGLRPGRRRLLLRRISSVLAVLALLCLALPLSFPPRIRGNHGSRVGVVLTHQYQKDSVLDFLEKHDAVIWKVGDTMPADMRRLTVWHVFGEGLPGQEWRAIAPPRLVFHPARIGAGLISAAWKRKLTSGDRLDLQGIWQGEGVANDKSKRAGPVKLLLTGMGMSYDSTEVPGKDGEMAREDGEAGSAIELSTVPAQLGRSVYHFLALSGGDTLEQEDIPVEILPGKPLKVLILASSPGFENRFLASWLVENGQVVASRSTISRGKYAERFSQVEPVPLGSMSQGVLGKFDLVVADDEVLRQLGMNVLALLQREVKDRGLGLIIWREDPRQAGNHPSPIENWPGAIVPRLAAARDTAMGFYLREDPGLRVLKRDSLLHVVAGSSLFGLGRLVFLSFPPSYATLLEGKKSEYASLWSTILRQAARPMPAEDGWTTEPSLPRVNEPVGFRLESGSTEIPRGEAGNSQIEMTTTVYLSEDPWLPFEWRGKYWPDKAGWQSIRDPGGSVSWWYAWPGGSWMVAHQTERRKETRGFIEEQSHAQNVGMIEDGTRGGEGVDRAPREPVPKVWFCSLFLITVAFLWVERKI